MEQTGRYCGCCTIPISSGCLMSASFDQPGIGDASPSAPLPRRRFRQPHVSGHACSIDALPGADRFGLEGEVITGFEPVARAFIENFERDGEVGAALCVITSLEGRF